MAFSLGFHIIFAAIGMVMPFLMSTAHYLHLKRRDPVYLQLTKMWMKGVAILFAVGAVSGTELSFDPVPGTQLWIQPRVRAFLVPTGVVKPYALGSLDLVIYDGFVPDTSDVDFPNAAGGLTVAGRVGAGVAIDATSSLSFFVEVPYSITISPLWRSYDDLTVTRQPAGIPGQGGLLRLMGGVGVHF